MSMTDNRIIQMQFENREFEKNIAKSQKSVEDLKKAMNFDETSEGLKKFSRGMQALDFSTLGSNIQRLTDKFTGLGNIGEYVLSRLRASIEGAASSMERFIRSISLEQISVGQSKYDALNKSVQTIIAGGKYTEKEAYGVMERVMAYTDQTSHNFQTMVGQISALQSVGMELGEAERFLEGIGNASTKAGAGATEAAAAMSLMAKVVGGTHLGKQQFDSMNQTYRVVTQEWRQMALDAAVEAGTLELNNGTYKTAKQFGKQVEVTASTLENTLAKGWFTGEVAKNLYSKYQFGKNIDELKHPDKVTDELQQFGKTAYLTGQRALTLADAMNAVRESVSSGWMETFRIALGDVTEAAEFFTNVCDRMIESLEPIKDFRNEVLKSWRTNGGHDSLLDILLGDYWKPEGMESDAVGFMDLLDGLGKIVYTGFQDFILLFASPVDRLMSKKYPDYFKAWLGARLADITENVQKFMQKIRDFFTEEIDVGGETKSRLEMIYDIVHGIVGALALGVMAVDGILFLIGEIRKTLGPGLDDVLLFFGDLGRAIFETARRTERSQKMQAFFKKLSDKIHPVASSLNELILSITGFLKVLLGLDKDGTNGISVLEQIGGAVLSVADAFNKVVTPVVDFITTVFGLLTTLAKDGVNKDSLSAFGVGLGEAFKAMMKSFADNLPEGLGFLGNWIRDLFGLWEEDAEHESNPFFAILHDIFSIGLGAIGDLFKVVAEMIEDGSFVTFFTELGTKFQPILDSLSALAKEAVFLIRTLLGLDDETAQTGDNTEAIRAGFTEAGDAIKTVASIISTYATPVINFFTELLRLTSKLISGDIDFGTFIQGIGSAFTNTFLTVLANARDWTKDLFGLWDDDAKNDAPTFFGNVRRIIESGFGFLSNVFDTVYGWVKDLFGLWDDDAKNEAPTFFGNIRRIAENGFSFFGDIFTAIYEMYKDGSLSSFFASLYESASPLIDGIRLIVTAFGDLLIAITGLGGGETEKGEARIEKIKNIITILGDGLRTVVDIVSKATGPVLTFLGDFIGLLTSLVHGDIDFEGFLSGIGTAFDDMIAMFRSYLPEDFSIIPDWLKNLFGSAGEEGEEQTDNFFTRFINYFKTNFGTASKALETIFGGFSLKAALESGFGFVSAFNFLGNIIGWFKGTNLYNVILAFLGVATLGSLFSLIMQARKAVKTIGGFFDDVGGSLKAGILGQYEWNSEKVLNFAKGILMIAASIMLLGSMDPKALIAGVAAVGLIFAALMIFVSIVNGDKFKANYGQQFAATAVIDAIAIAIVSIVAALSVLMLAMTPLAAMGWQSVAATILGFVVVVATLGSFIVIMLKQMNKFMKEAFYGNRWSEIGKMAVMMLLLTVTVSAISLAVGALMIAMAPIAAIGWQGALTAALTLAAVMAAIGTFMMVMMNQMNQFMRNSFYSNGWGEIGKMAAMMILLAATVAILASGISVLIVAMAPLAAMSWQSVLAASAGVGIVLAVIGTFIMVMLNQMDNFVSAIGGGGTSWGGIAKMAAMMLALSLMVSLLSVGISAIIIAITPLAAMSAAGVAKAVIGLGVILFELGAFMKTLLSMADASGATVKLMGFTAFAFSIGVLVFALTPLALMDWAGWGRAMLGLAIVLGALIGAMKLMQMANVSTVALAGFAGFAASIGILIFALQPLAGMDWGGWGRAMIGLGLVLAELIGAMKLMDMLKVNTGTLFGFIGFAASIAILIYALKPLAEMDTEGYYRAIFGLGTVMLEVVALMAIMNELKPDLKTAGSVLLMMVGVGAAMILFGIAFNEVKDVPWQNIVAFGTAIALIVAALGVAAKGAKALSFKGILMLALGLAAILGVIALMAPLLIGSVASALTDMASSFTLISSLMESASTNSNNVDEGGIDKMIRILGKMKDLFLGLVGFKLIKGSIDSFTEAVAALNLAAGQLQMLNQKLSGLSDDGGMGKLKKTAQSIKDLFTNELSDISSYEGKANSFSTVMYQLGTALGTFRDLTKDVVDPEESNAIKMIQTLADSGTGLDVLSKLSLTGLTSQIAALGGAMMLYAQGAEAVGTVEGYEEGKIDDQKVTAAVGLMQSISTSLSEAGGFTIPENMPGEEELGMFGASLAALAGALVQLEQAGSSLGNGWENALNVFDFFQKLKARLAATEFFTNLKEFLFMGGESLKENKANELTVFGNNISQLAQSMGQFVTSTTYLDETTHEVKQYDYTNAISAMESIAEIPRKMPPLTGPTLLLIGRRISLTTFAEQIELLGSALKDFHTNTTTTDNGIPTEFTYTNAIKALESIAAIPGKMPVAPGWIPRLWKSDPPDLTKLSEDIIALGGGLKQFAKDLAGDDKNPAFDPNTVQPAIDSLDPMITLMTQLKDKVPQVGGLAQILPTLWKGRDFTLNDLSDQIGKLGDGLGKLGAGINSGEWKDTNGTKYAFEALDSVLGVMLKLEQMTGFTGSAYANLDKLTYFIEGLTGMNTYEDGKKHNPIADSLVDFMDQLNTAFVMLEDDDGYLNMTLDRFEMFKTFAEGLNQLTNSDLTVDWSFIGTKLTTDVATSITTGTDNVITSFSGLLTAIQNAGVTPTVVTWESIGTAIDTGIVNGINGGTDGVTQAARNIAKAAYDAAMAQLDANSPSKVFTEVGSYIGLGMAQGIDRSASNVVDSATGMSENAIVTAGTLMAKISQVMAEGTDTNPTITPVLDLSQVEAGISELGGMGGNMSINTAYASGMAARAISSSGRDSNQNGTDLSGVYERMTQLSNQILGMNKAISNMKLVLNTGVVAGGVTDDVDANIGRKAFYAYRNN